MKILFIFLISLSAWAKPTVINFNQILNEDVQKDIAEDEEKLKTYRGPASVNEENQKRRPVMNEPSKIDKNVRQIGPNNW